MFPHLPGTPPRKPLEPNLQNPLQELPQRPHTVLSHPLLGEEFPYREKNRKIGCPKFQPLNSGGPSHSFEPLGEAERNSDEDFSARRAVLDRVIAPTRAAVQRQGPMVRQILVCVGVCFLEGTGPQTLGWFKGFVGFFPGGWLSQVVLSLLLFLGGFESWCSAPFLGQV